MWQALTTVSVCFNVNEPKLDLSGLTAAIADFWLNNPAVQAPSRRLKLGFGAVLSASFAPTASPEADIHRLRLSFGGRPDNGWPDDDGLLSVGFPFSTPRQSKTRWMK